MRKIELVSMHIENFKGLRDFRVDIDGKDAVISGANATGKTTVYDAFLWLLFGKDSGGAADFDFKPLDASGADIHNLETSVTAVLRIDGEARTLKRLSAEKWSRPRGQIDHVYGGNQSSFWVDEVPRTLTEYKAYVDGIVPEDVFRLITSHTAFNAQKMADRRKALIAVAGVDADAQLAAQFPDAGAVLAGGSPEDAKRRLREVRKRLNAELDAVPARIDELAKLSGDEKAKRDAEYYIKEYADNLAIVDQLIAEQRAEDPATAAKARLSAIEREMALLEREAKTVRANAVQAALTEVQRITRERDYNADRASDAAARIESAEKAVAERESDIEFMRTEWRKKSEIPYKPAAVDGACPTCGQALPVEQVEEARRKDREQFDAVRQLALDEIQGRGKRLRAALDEDKARLEKLRADLTIWTAKRDGLDGPIKAAGEAYDAAKAAFEVLPPEHAALAAEAAALRAQPPGDDKAMRDLTERRAELTGKIERHRATVAEYAAYEAARKRIDELTAEQRALGDKVAEVDQQLILLERYVSARCALLEDGINERFPTVKWRLFTRLDNGGIEDACDCMIPSPSGAMVAYGRSANTGAKINAGLEIINVLCGFYGVAAPVFCDNAESVNTLIPTVGQQIRLVVTEGESLKVEVAA